MYGYFLVGDASGRRFCLLETRSLQSHGYYLVYNHYVLVVSPYMRPSDAWKLPAESFFIHQLVAVASVYSEFIETESPSQISLFVKGWVNIHDMVYGATFRFQLRIFRDQETVHDVHVSSTHI